jgi:putative endopeptidase
MSAYSRFCLIALATGSMAWGSCKQASETPGVGLIDQSASDSSVRPQDDFFTYANGTWIKNTEIPASQSSWGAFVSLTEESLNNMHHILDSLSKESGLAKNTPAQRAADLYSSIMDSATIESKGLTPLKADFDRINAIKDVQGILDEVARQYTEGNGSLFSFAVGPDDKNSMEYVAQLGQGGMGLPSTDYYFKQDSSIKKIRDAYVAFITKAFVIQGATPTDAFKRASAVLAAETELAKVSKDPIGLRDPEANYHKMTVNELDKLTPGINWMDMLTKLQINADTVLVRQPAFFTGLDKALKSVSLAQWKDYLTFQEISNYSGVLNHDVQDAAFDYAKLLSGQKVQRERWKRACAMVDGNLGDDLGQMYVKQFFPPEAKERIKQLVDNLQATYAERIQQLDWMSDSTKKKALVKLHAMAKKVGYPDKWKDYASVSIDKGDAVGNIRSCSMYEYNRMAKKVGQPVDRSEWFMTPPTVNAYYDPTANNINFPAGILRPPFFYVDGDDALNYGAIGMVIGHEMTHGFDDQGRLYDENGNLRSWWSPEDSARFVQKANLIVKQYDGYVAVDTFHIHGSLTLGENIADLGGITLAYAAFKKTAEGKDTTTKIDGLTSDQRFFRGFAQGWKIKVRPERLRFQTMTNPHSAPHWRVNGPLSNLEAFYQTYDVKPGDQMYRPDSLRAKIW